MPELQEMRAAHREALLAFERENREYFGAFISDRGDEYFEHFDKHLDEALAEQAAGVSAFFVLIDENGSVTGRVNLFDLRDGSARLGYRVAAAVSGRGVATAAVGDVCALAARRFALCSLRAAVSSANVASQKVLINNGFVAVGPAAPSDLGGKTGTWYERELENDGRTELRRLPAGRD